jgi:hypothetical protein
VGLGVDRKAGDYRISGTALVHHELSRTDLSLVVSADRAFAREKYNVRIFGVYGATEGSGFVRAVTTAKLRDDVALEVSVGWFAGDGRDLVGRFGDSDFLCASEGVLLMQSIPGLPAFVRAATSRLTARKTSE